MCVAMKKKILSDSKHKHKEQEYKDLRVNVHQSIYTIVLITILLKII